MKRSYLFVPGDRPERVAKALASPAHAVIVDLEDAVAPADKARARRAVVDDPRVLVRINAAGTEWHEDDLAFLAQRRIGGVVLPQAEEAFTVERVARRVSVPVVPLVESARGLHAIDLIATARGVARLAFGHLDFQLDIAMQCEDDERERRANLPAPIDGVTVALDDDVRLARDTERSRRLGFGAKLCIHPKQVDTVNTTFAPTPEQLDWARRVIDAATNAGGAFRLDGRMVDAPVLQRARSLLEAA
jgi:citrate lyase subunit beta/citryl-CoA lyase